MKRFPTSILLSAAVAFAADALVNGGFEQGLAGWTVVGTALASAERAEGDSACLVRLAEPGWSGVSQAVPIPSGAGAVRVSGWLRADSVRGGENNWERGRIQVGFRTAEGDTVGGHPFAVGQVRGRMPWHRYAKTYPIPRGASTLEVGCMLGQSSGALRCDGLSAEFLP